MTKKYFYSNIASGIVSSLLASAIIAPFAFLFPSNPFLPWLIFIIVVLIALLSRYLWSKYERIIKLVISTDTRYYYSFEEQDEKEVWAKAGKSLHYLGVSSNSIFESFKRWAKENPCIDCQFLLLNPAGKSLRRQEAFELGYTLDVDLDHLPIDAQQNINKKAAATASLIKSTVENLKTLENYVNGYLKVKYYDEFTPFWMYLVDERDAYVGILRRNKRGTEPVIAFGENKNFASPFDTYHNHWMRLWNDATDA